MKIKDHTSDNKSIEDLQEQIESLTRCVNQLVIEQDKLKREVNQRNEQDRRRKGATEDTTKKNQSSRKKSTKLDIGDTVRVISTHKNRNGTIGKITGYRGSTQFIVTSSQEAETLADREFAVWKSNVVAVHLSTNKQAH